MTYSCWCAIKPSQTRQHIRTSSLKVVLEDEQIESWDRKMPQEIIISNKDTKQVLPL